MVEDLFKNREPALNAAGIYFITPCDASVQRLLDEWRGPPTYGSAHIFFTSKVAPRQLAAIKGCPGLIARLRALVEVRGSSMLCAVRLSAQRSAFRAMRASLYSTATLIPSQSYDRAQLLAYARERMADSLEEISKQNMRLKL